MTLTTPSLLHDEPPPPYDGQHTQSRTHSRLATRGVHRDTVVDPVPSFLIGLHPLPYTPQCVVCPYLPTFLPTHLPTHQLRPAGTAAQQLAQACLYGGYLLLLYWYAHLSHPVCVTWSWTCGMTGTRPSASACSWTSSPTCTSHTSTWVAPRGDPVPPFPHSPSRLSSIGKRRLSASYVGVPPHPPPA